MVAFNEKRCSLDLAVRFSLTQIITSLCQNGNHEWRLMQGPAVLLEWGSQGMGWRAFTAKRNYIEWFLNRRARSQDGLNLTRTLEFEETGRSAGNNNRIPQLNSGFSGWGRTENRAEKSRALTAVQNDQRHTDMNGQ